MFLFFKIGVSTSLQYSHFIIILWSWYMYIIVRFFKMFLSLGVVAHACDPTFWKGEAGGSPWVL